MIIKNFETKKVNFEKNNILLLYGENDGAKDDFLKIILKEKFKKIQNYNENEVLENLDNFYDTLLTKSFFDQEKIIVIKKTTNKIVNFVEEIVSKKIQELILILTSDSLDKKSKLRNLFEKDKHMICVAFYPDTYQSLNFIIIDFLKQKKINLSQQSINLIIERSNGNRQHLKNELDKLENLSASNKKINFDQIIKLTNLSSQNSVSELIDFCLSKNKIKMIKILNENNFSEEDSILILRTLLSKTKRLFKLKKDQKMNNNLDNLILSYKPPIFWKEKDFVKQQIKLWKDFDIKKLISQINEVELLIKKTPINSKYILNNLLFETSSQN